MESNMGFKFQPSDELIGHFLKKKRLDPHFTHHPIKDIDHICSLEPWDLAAESETESDDQVWYYFFYKPYYPYRGSKRAHRGTEAGHWTITSSDSKIKTRNGFTVTKKVLTFYLHGPDSKAEAKTDWVMHEYHVKDDPCYKKEFVLCRIQRKRNKRRKHRVSTTDEEESSDQLVSLRQQSPSDHSISNGHCSEENTHTIPHQQPQNHNSISSPGSLTVDNTIYLLSITNDTPTQLSLSKHRNHNGEIIPTKQPLLENPSEETTLTYPQQLPNHNSIPYPRTNPLLPPDSNLESQLPTYHPSVTQNFAENNFQEERLPIGEIKLYGGCNRLNDGSSSAVQTLISQEQESNYSNSSFDNCDFSDCQIFSDDSPRAFQDEYSGEETGQTRTPDFNPSKLDGEASAYAEYSSDTNTDDNCEWVKELILKKDECLLIGEFKSCCGSNRLNDASFSAPQTTISKEQGSKYSNSSFDNYDFSDCQIFSYDSPWAFQDECSRDETGQTLTPDFNPSKSDGEALSYAADSSNTNTACNDAWMKERLENFA